MIDFNQVEESVHIQMSAINLASNWITDFHRYFTVMGDRACGIHWDNSHNATWKDSLWFLGKKGKQFLEEARAG